MILSKKMEKLKIFTIFCWLRFLGELFSNFSTFEVRVNFCVFLSQTEVFQENFLAFFSNLEAECSQNGSIIGKMFYFIYVSWI